MGFLVGLGGIDLLTMLVSESCTDDVGGISSHSLPAISRGRRKNGQSVVSSLSDSFASRVDIGTGDDLMIAATTSEVGRALRFRIVGVEVGPTGAEKSIQALSATPPRRPSKQRRRISS